MTWGWAKLTQILNFTFFDDRAISPIFLSIPLKVDMLRHKISKGQKILWVGTWRKVPSFVAPDFSVFWTMWIEK